MGRPHLMRNSAIYRIPMAVNGSLPECVIIDLHELFLTKGIHMLHAIDHCSGIGLIHSLLQSLNYYQTIGFLSLEQLQEYKGYYNIHGLLLDCGYLEQKDQYALDHFFSDLFFLDFMIIDATQELMAQPWFDDFVKSIQRVSLDTQLPIVVITST